MTSRFNMYSFAVNLCFFCYSDLFINYMKVSASYTLNQKLAIAIIWFNLSLQQQSAASLFFRGETCFSLREAVTSFEEKYLFLAVVAHKWIGLYFLMLDTTDVIFFFKLHMKQLAILSFLDG